MMFTSFIFNLKMTLNESYRKLINVHYQKGKNVNEIYEALGRKVSKRTIYNWIDKINKRKSIVAYTSPGRKRSVRSKTFIAKVKRNVLTNKKRKSAKKLAKELGCAKFTIDQTIHVDLGLKCYRAITVPALTDSDKKKRKTCCEWIRKKFNKKDVKSIMHSDEKMFDGDGQFNIKNDVVYAESREEANLNGGLHPKRKYPYRVMVWVGLTYNGPTTPVFLPAKTSFDSQFYITNASSYSAIW